MSPTPLVLKNPKGWFAAGAEVQQALTQLSDGAFKLFIYLCLHARRDTATLETTQTELARQLHKSTSAIRNYLHEMQAAGVCRTHFVRHPHRRGHIEITEPFWPYRKAESQLPDDPAQVFVSTLKKLLEAHPCIQCVFSTADEILARQWFRQGLSVQQIEQAVLLGCVRKYAAWRNHPRQGPIRSLRYFQSVLEELHQQDLGSAYCDYLRSRLHRMVKLWNQAHGPALTVVEQPSSASPDSQTSTTSSTAKERR